VIGRCCDIDPDRRKAAATQERVIEMKKPANNKLAALFSQDEVQLLQNLLQKMLHVTEQSPTTEYSDPNVPDSNKPDPEPPAPEVPAMHLEQQKAIVQYAPKEKLWKILEVDNAWFYLLQHALPPQYFEHFMQRMNQLAIRDQTVIERMAEMYVKYKVAHEYLSAAVAACWSPADLAEGTQFLNEHGFLQRPLLPINLRAESTQARKERLAKRS
jgi:hypothetical protein